MTAVERETIQAIELKRERMGRAWGRLDRRLFDLPVYTPTLSDEIKRRRSRLEFARHRLGEKIRSESIRLRGAG